MENSWISACHEEPAEVARNVLYMDDLPSFVVQNEFKTVSISNGNGKSKGLSMSQTLFSSVAKG